MSERFLSRIILFGNDPGDQQWSILEYGEQLQRALSKLLKGQCHIDLLAPNTQDGLWQRLRRWRMGRAAAMYWTRYVHYPQLMRGREADIYHFLDYGNGWLIQYLDPARTVVTCHDLIPRILHNQRGSLWPLVSEVAYRHAVSGLTRAAAILANSPCTRRDLIARFGIPEGRIHVVPLGLDPHLGPPSTPKDIAAARTALQLPEGFLLLHVGHTVFYKNIEGILRGLEILLRRGEHVWLIRAGALLRSSQRQLAQHLGVADRVVELGPMPRNQLRRLYHAADLLVHPSWYEGLGLPPLEAMASGVPVVASNRGALPETVGDAGLIVDPDVPEQLADAIQRLLHEPALQEDLRKRGFIRASQFRWETTAQQTLQVYRSLIHERL